MTEFKYPDAVVLVFAKAPVAGEVNTRLIPDIGVESATDLQKELISSRLENLRSNNLCTTQLWCAPDATHEFFKKCQTQFNIELYQQSGDDLGARMSSAIEQSLKKVRRVVLIGTDAPSLTIEHIETALKQLANNDVVIGPADDGGYVLIGMSKHCDAVFQDVEWGTDEVLEVTRVKIKKNGLSCFELESCWDIDRVGDYQRYKNN
jgi:rSAM/selenodomain-associated transferase 1